MSRAIRQASNVIVVAAHLYVELALSASDLLRPDTYRGIGGRSASASSLLEL